VSIDVQSILAKNASYDFIFKTRFVVFFEFTEDLSKNYGEKMVGSIRTPTLIQGRRTHGNQLNAFQIGGEVIWTPGNKPFKMRQLVNSHF